MNFYENHDARMSPTERITNPVSVRSVRQDCLLSAAEARRKIIRGLNNISDEHVSSSLQMTRSAFLCHFAKPSNIFSQLFSLFSNIADLPCHQNIPCSLSSHCVTGRVVCRCGSSYVVMQWLDTVGRHGEEHFQANYAQSGVTVDLTQINSWADIARSLQVVFFCVIACMRFLV